jgi:hypothetical protein
MAFDADGPGGGGGGGNTELIIQMVNVDGKTSVSLNPGIAPETWGVIINDMLDVIAATYQHAHGLSADQTRKTILMGIEFR